MRRSFDIVVWGATGFSGELIAEYLAEFYPPQKGLIRWAIAGRNEKKLNELNERLCLINRSCEMVQVLVGDIDDQSSIDSLVQQSKVVIGAAGPFSLYGTAIVDSCVRMKTDYCDITGESDWVRKIIDLYHEDAVKNDVLIVPMCGFDCVPSDLGTFMVVQHIQSTLQKEVSEVKSFLSLKSSGISGGTAASILNSTSKPLKFFLDPYYLNPSDKKPNNPKKDSNGSFFLKYDYGLKSFTAPFFLSPMNVQVVNRSSVTNNPPYAKNFKYFEGLNSASFFRAFQHLLTFVFLRLFFFPLFRKIFSKVVPKPGEGPSNDRKSGEFSLKIIGKSCPPNASTVVGIVKGVGGTYFSSAVMSVECALCLVLSRDKLGNQGGVCTPATAFGNVLLARLRNAGMTFNIEKK